MFSIECKVDGGYTICSVFLVDKGSSKGSQMMLKVIASVRICQFFWIILLCMIIFLCKLSR